ncbi:MAG: heparan-alpha-glucosaminide N-acetyltransferase domain-containing protein [Phototrophicaceae bacterium]
MRKAITNSDTVLIKQKRWQLLKRTLFLFIFGLLYTPIWSADILHFYGLYLLLGTALILSSDRTLWLTAGATVLIFILLLFIFDYEAGWNFDTFEYTDFWTPVGMIRHLFFNGFHPFFPWVAFLLIGIWLGRQDWSNPQYRLKLLGIASVIAIFTEALSTSLTTILADTDELALFFDTSPLPPMPLYIIAGASTAIVVIIICLIVTEKFTYKVWFPLVATGQLALTLYVAHVVIGMGILEAIGWFENSSIEQVFIATGIFYVGSIIFSAIWRSRFKRGPLEAVMRRLTD